MQALGGWINWGQSRGQRRRVVDIDELGFRMDHFELALDNAYLPEAAQPIALVEEFLLVGAEIEEAHGDQPGGVGELRHQHAARTTLAPKANADMQNLGLDLASLPGLQRTEWGNEGTILVTQRQVEQQVALRIQTEAL